MKRITLPLLGGLLLLAGCQDRDLPTALAPEGPSLSLTQSAAAPVVTSLEDADVCSATECTLRGAIAFADPGAEITFALGLTGTITLTTEPLWIGKNLTITGPGAASLSVSGSNATRVLDVAPGALGAIGVSISGVTITGGRVSSEGGGTFVAGGGIYIDYDATLTLMNSAISGNSASYAGGIYNRGTLTLTNSAISGNSAEVAGGGIYNEATLTLMNSPISGNSAEASGGGIYNEGTLTVTNSTVSDNDAPYGGGILNFEGATLKLTNSTVSNNSASLAGGGIHNSGTLTITHSTLDGNTAFSGGGIQNFGTPTIAHIAHSTLSGNIADSEGGGLRNMFGAVTLTNTTVSGNSALMGGGIFNASARLTITHSTLSGNISTSESGFAGIFSVDLSFVTLRNTLIANSTGHDCESRYGVYDEGYNLVEDGGCIYAATSRSGDPLLGPLSEENGGPTATHALLPGSPAIDAGSCTDLDEATVQFDQRGVERPQGTACDIGAFEYVPPAPPGFNFTGFFAPVDNLPTINQAKAGSAIPVKFSLGGDHGLGIMAAGYPKSVAVPCDATAPVEAIDETVTAGSSSLSYDAATGQYTYVWKTEKGWTGCRQLEVKLSDGTSHHAIFKFTK